MMSGFYAQRETIILMCAVLQCALSFVRVQQSNDMGVGHLADLEASCDLSYQELEDLGHIHPRLFIASHSIR